MHDVLNRMNEILTLMIIVLTCQASLVCLSTFHHDYSGNFTVSVFDVVVSEGDGLDDEGGMKFDLKTNLSQLFDWNAKQFYLYLIAEYKTNSNALNQIVIWDKIVLRGSKSYISLKKKLPMYEVLDDGKGLIGNSNVTLRLAWNVIPSVGKLQDVPNIQSLTFGFPSEYKTMSI